MTAEAPPSQVIALNRHTLLRLANAIGFFASSEVGGRAAANRDYEMGTGELVGEVDFDGPWAAGYQPPKIIKAPVSTAASQ